MKIVGRIMVLLIAVMISIGPLHAQTVRTSESVGEFALFIQNKYGFKFLSKRMSNATKLMLIYGAELGRQRVHSAGYPNRDAHLDNIQDYYEVVCASYTAFTGDDMMSRCLMALLGGYNEETEQWIRDEGGQVPATSVDYFTHNNWPSATANPTVGSGVAIGIPPFPDSNTLDVSGTGTMPTPLAPGGAQPAGPLDMPDGSPVGNLYGVPLCTWEMKAIATGETSDPDYNLFSDSYNVVSVPAREEHRFYIDLYHRGLDRVANLSGTDARNVLVSKGYFEYSAPNDAYVSTPAYTSFVNHSQQAPPTSPVCGGDAPAPIPPGPGGVGVIYGKVRVATEVNNWNSYGKYGVSWHIDNPSGIEIRFPTGKVTKWELKHDYSGGVTGGEYVTRKTSLFTVPAGGRETSDEFFVPCVSGVCQGTVLWEYEGEDGNGNPVRLILEFSTSGG